MSTLIETDSLINPLRLPSQASLIGIGTDDEAGLTSSEGAIVIRLDLSGIYSVHVLARESSTEERLQCLLNSVYPILEQLQATVNAFTCEPVGASG